jgi:hypothetical protein
MAYLPEDCFCLRARLVSETARVKASSALSPELDLARATISLALS